jgi:hypothetical protein
VPGKFFLCQPDNAGYEVPGRATTEGQQIDLDGPDLAKGEVNVLDGTDGLKLHISNLYCGFVGILVEIFDKVLLVGDFYGGHYTLLIFWCTIHLFAVFIKVTIRMFIVMLGPSHTYAVFTFAFSVISQ